MSNTYLNESHSSLSGPLCRPSQILKIAYAGKGPEKETRAELLRGQFKTL